MSHSHHDDHCHSHNHGHSHHHHHVHEDDEEASETHHCCPHEENAGTQPTSRSSSFSHATRRKLWIALTCCCVFMVIEFIGGILGGSLALLSDAVHMLSDVAGFGIAITASIVSEWTPTTRYTYGYRRAEVIGCLLSITLTIVLIVVLCIESFRRLFHPETVDAKTMFVVALCGLVGNFVILGVLRGCGKQSESSLHLHSHFGQRCNHHHGHSHHHHEDPADTSLFSGITNTLLHPNLNMRATVVHVLGDILQSIAVLVSSIIIWIAPKAVVVDPLCTLLFCIIQMFTVVNVTRDALGVIMQRVPTNIDIEVLSRAIEDEVRVSEDERAVSTKLVKLWSITNEDDVVGAVRVQLMPGVQGVDQYNAIQQQIESVCRRYGCSETTIQ
eukprot:PhF_6_TR33547/c0_g1_i3/m.48911/K14689/SLC30A2, ZNT2; solute carrier family 30 (zinc transporter), member 2